MAGVGLLRLAKQWLGRRSGLTAALYKPMNPPPGIKTYFIICLCVLGYALALYVVAYLFHSNNAQGGLFGSLRDIWKQWDTSNYMFLAESGYVTGQHEELFIVFFPLYPFLMSLLVKMGISSFAAGIIVSLCSLMAAACYLFALVSRERDKKEAVWALVFMALGPGAFFLVSVFTESLFLALSVACFYYLRKEKFLIAAIVGALAAFTRNIGVLLIFPFILEWLEARRFGQMSRNKKHSIKRLLLLLIIPLGTLGYLLINYALFTDPFRFMDIQKNHWSQEFTFFIHNIAQIGTRIFTYGDAGIISQIWLPEFMAILFSLVCLALAGNRLRPSYILYMAVYIAVAAAPSWLLSGVRYFAVLFPVALLMAGFARKNFWLGATAALLSGAAMVVLMLMHTSGQQVM